MSYHFSGSNFDGDSKKQLKMQNLTHFLRYGDALYIFYIIDQFQIKAAITAGGANSEIHDSHSFPIFTGNT